MKTVSDLGEFGLIAALRKQLGGHDRSVAVGIGDDCAVLRTSDPGKLLLYTCDPVVEGIHYLKGTPARQIGWKAMARNLSDIAAMGGLPRWAVVSIGLRQETPVRFVQELYAGLKAAGRKFGCHIVGGDTTHVRGEQFVVVTLLGEVERARLALRSGAKPGDLVFVTGKLGGSIKGKHLNFVPRIEEARWLTKHFRIHSMMDVSDGLASDLQRIMEASRVGFDLDAEKIPVNKARGGTGVPACAGPALSPSLRAALSDGEDFELVFTISSREAAALRKKWKFKLPLTEIGRVIKKRDLLLNGAPLTAHGYDHFHRH